MAKNPEWFLDAADFASSVNTDPKAISYPSVLEPPRGWCGSIKKRDVKGKSADSWPEGEEPRLRCTFCRRTYAGINAKSMWRRHVFEKHKIAMANRRDGPERGRGRVCNNKENKQSGHRNRNSLDYQHIGDYNSDEIETRNIFTRPFQVHVQSNDSAAVRVQPKLRSLLPIGLPPTTPKPLAPALPQSEFPAPPNAATRASPPALSDCKSTSLSSSNITKSFPLPSTPSSPPMPSLPALPLSPYDPTQTPSFKHSPLHLPCEQPWRFPSPSHPLHSSPDELCLGIAVRGIVGNGLHSSYLPAMSSPLGPASLSRTQSMPASSSPAMVSPLKRKIISGKVWRLDERGGWNASDLALQGVPKPEPRRLFYSGPLPVPVSDRVDFKLGSSSPTNTDSDSSESPDSSFNTDVDDPFGAWFDMNGVSSHKGTGLLPDSPVLRTVALPVASCNSASLAAEWQRQPSGIGLGISLPKVISHDGFGSQYPSATIDELEQLAIEADDFEGELNYPPSSQEELQDFDDDNVEAFLDTPFATPPPLKRRRTIDIPY